MPRFVLLYHELPPGSRRASHWDLMLECDGVLATWALTEELQPGHCCHAIKLSDHRLAYLDYEGPVSTNRGVVRRLSSGAYVLREQSQNRWQADLQGDTLSGTVTLTRVGDGDLRLPAQGVNEDCVNEDHWMIGIEDSSS